MPEFLGSKWLGLGGATPIIPWSFAEGNVATITSRYAGYLDIDSPIEAQYRDTVRAAFAAWAAVTNIIFEEVPDGRTGTIRLGNHFIDGRSLTEASVAGQTQSWGFQSSIEASQIVFDVDAYDDEAFYEIVLHEIGHALGLGHSEFEASVMYPQVNGYNFKGFLATDDLLGIAELYGTRDDFEGSNVTAGRATVGGVVGGTIEKDADDDWFAVALTSGRSYRIDLKGYDSDVGSLDDPLLEIYSGAGARLAQDDDGGLGLESRLIFTPTTSATYFLSAKAFLDEEFYVLGSYRLSVTDITTGADGAAALRSAATTILRQSNTPAAAEIAARVESGQTTFANAAADLVRAAAATSSVATLSYQFFTGKVPGGPGMDFLVSPTGPNANNLNSAYYQAFSLENRYINFAVNLGKAGEGKDAFLAGYGSLDLFEATRKAYGVIFGAAPNDAKLHAILDPSFTLGTLTLTRSEYFAYYGGDGLTGIGTKAAMVGFLLAEAVKADLGVYAKVNDAFLTDLLDGADFAVDIVAAYSKPEYVFGG